MKLLSFLLFSSCSAFVVSPSVKPRVSETPVLGGWRRGDEDKKEESRGLWKLGRRVADRLNTIEAAGFKPGQVRTSGLFGPVKKAHNPITYLSLSLLAGLRWSWCFRNPYYWFVVGFFVKWYRARYVFKIPVWDRQPNWNNIITSKEQEKDLKAFTCKKCGSTIFIAKTREFFFEGDTGIGGLGCFSCGAKGKENFVMDRDRIVEDVADIDDYFEYERPLDFVSRAERRKLLKEAAGDEEQANKLLVERSASEESPALLDSEVVDTTAVEDVSIEEEGAGPQESAKDPIEEEDQPESAWDEPLAEDESTPPVDLPASAPSPPKQSSPPPPKPSTGGEDELDLLGMDI